MNVVWAVCDSEPLVPVSATSYVPAVPLQDSIEVAEEPLVTVTLGVFREHVRLGEETDSVRLTVPENPLMLITVTVEVSVAPGIPVTVVGFSEMEKSCTMQFTVAVWESAPLVPVTVTVNVPALPLPDSVEVPE